MRKLYLISSILILGLLTVPIASAEETVSPEPQEIPQNETPVTEIKEAEGKLTASAEPAMAMAGAGETALGGIAGSVSGFLNESFQVDSATGTASLTIPIAIPPGRKNIQPNVALSYSSNNPNGICGVGWAIPTSAIQRSTKNGVPKYDSTDEFIFSGGSNAELVNIGDNEYRAKIESGFMRFLFSNNFWTVYDKSGTKYIFGQSSATRLENGSNIFSWFLDRVEDTYGNYVTYIYEKPADGQIYLKEIQYAGASDMAPDKSVIFNYSADRSDNLYSYRSGWSITTTKLLSDIEVKLNNNLVWRYNLSYIQSADTARNLLESITVSDAGGNSLPPKKFTYSRLE